MNINDIPLRTFSNPSLSIKETNALLTELRQYTHSRRVNQSGLGAALIIKAIEDEKVQVEFQASYPSYSIFTIQVGTGVFHPTIPNPDSKTVINAGMVQIHKGQIYLTNGSQPVEDGTIYSCHILDEHYPHKIRYDGTTPEIGDRLQIVSGQSYISIRDNGFFVAVAEPDLVSSTVWVVKNTDFPRRLKGVVTESGGIAYNSNGEVTIYRQGIATAETVDAYLNWMHGNMNISENKKVIVEWFEDEEKWVITNAECE